MITPRTFDEAMAKVKRFETALIEIASLRDGPMIAGRVAEPRSARIAREALGLPGFVMPTREPTGEQI